MSQMFLRSINPTYQINLSQGGDICKDRHGQIAITLHTFTWMYYQTISFVGPTSCDLLYNLPVLRVERKYSRCIRKKTATNVPVGNVDLKIS